MEIKDLVNIVKGTVEVYKKVEYQTCVGGGDCFNCEYFYENAYNIGEESCSGERHFEETEETLFEGVIEDVPYKLANENVVSVHAEHYKPYHKPRKARTLIKIEVQGDTD